MKGWGWVHRSRRDSFVSFEHYTDFRGERQCGGDILGRQTMIMDFLTLPFPKGSSGISFQPTADSKCNMSDLSVLRVLPPFDVFAWSTWALGFLLKVSHDAGQRIGASWRRLSVDESK